MFLFDTYNDCEINEDDFYDERKKNGQLLLWTWALQNTRGY